MFNSELNSNLGAITGNCIFTKSTSANSTIVISTSNRKTLKLTANSAYSSRGVYVKANSTSGTTISTLNHATVNTITVDVSAYDQIALVPYTSLSVETGYNFSYELT